MKNTPKIDEVLLTPEVLERLKNRDERFRDLDIRLQVERELRESVCLKLVLEAASEQGAEALEALAEVDPTDVKMIVRLQSAVQRVRFIARTLNRVIQKGEVAEQSLNEEQAVTINDNNGE